MLRRRDGDCQLNSAEGRNRSRQAGAKDCWFSGVQKKGGGQIAVYADESEEEAPPPEVSPAAPVSGLKSPLARKLNRLANCVFRMPFLLQVWSGFGSEDSDLTRLRQGSSELALQICSPKGDVSNKLWTSSQQAEGDRTS